MKTSAIIRVVLLLVLSFPVPAQTRNDAKSLPKLLSLREQQSVREGWLKNASIRCCCP
jgi:hypothetical protein